MPSPVAMRCTPKLHLNLRLKAWREGRESHNGCDERPESRDVHLHGMLPSTCRMRSKWGERGRVAPPKPDGYDICRTGDGHDAPSPRSALVVDIGMVVHRRFRYVVWGCSVFLSTGVRIFGEGGDVFLDRYTASPSLALLPSMVVPPDDRAALAELPSACRSGTTYPAVEPPRTNSGRPGPGPASLPRKNSFLFSFRRTLHRGVVRAPAPGHRAVRPCSRGTISTPATGSGSRGRAPTGPQCSAAHARERDSFASAAAGWPRWPTRPA